MSYNFMRGKSIVNHSVKAILCILLLLVVVQVVQAAGITANFSANITTGTVPLTVKFTDKSAGSPTGWAWFFGDETYSQSWTQQNASSGWEKRTYQTTVVMQDGTIVLMGGSYYPNYFNDTWRSTDSGVTWMLVNASSGWSNRSAHSSVAMPDGSIVLMGGSSSGDIFLNDTWKSTDKGTTWTLVNESSGWSKRSFQTSVAMPDGTIVLMGGWDGSIAWNDTWKSTDGGTTWTLVNASSGWSERSDLLSVVMPDGSIVLIWGVTDHIGMYDTWRSTDAGATWTEISAVSMPERPYAGSVAMPDGSILIMGGDGPYSYNDMWRSTNYGATWTQVNADCGWSRRTRIHSLAMPDGSIVLMGDRKVNDTWRFQPAGSSAHNPLHTYTQPGTYQVTLQAYNAGGYNSIRKTGYITVNAPPVPPTVTGIKPVARKQGALVTVTNLSGTGFKAGAKVYLTKAGRASLTATNVTVVNAKKIRCTVKIPADAVIGPWNVKVMNTDKTSGAKSNAFTIKTPLPPTVTKLMPATGKRGTTVQISNLAGTGFVATPKPTVKLLKGSAVISATNITIVSANKITCTLRIPATAATGAWNARVINADQQAGTKTGAFFVNA